MSETTGQSAEVPVVRYELSLTPDEAQRGVLKLLTRNGKRLEVEVPPGVNTGSVVKLANAMQNTDGQTGDIIIQIKVKSNETFAGGEAGGVIEITDANFDSQVLESTLPALVDFWAPWCGPCRMMAPVMAEAAVQYQGKVKFCKINVDENQQSASRYKAMSIPLLIFFQSGKVVGQSLGAIPAPQLKNKLDALLNIKPG